MILDMLRRSLAQVVRSDVAYRVLDTSFGRSVDFLRIQRRLWLDERQSHEPDPQLEALGLTVLHGPFQGMHYSSRLACGSTLAPKLIGSYEQEIAQLIEAVCARQPRLIVDVGAAEGYYAVGLAIRCPQAHVWAFDVDVTARDACSAMARLNGVDERLDLGSFCSPEDLKRICFQQAAIIICDCEGYEDCLLTEEAARTLADAVFIVEVHDFLDIELSFRICDSFAATHHVESILSVDDLIKAQTYVFPELVLLSIDQRRRLLAEHRPCTMRWLYLTPLHSTIRVDDIHVG